MQNETLDFYITRRGELFHDGDLVAAMESPEAAADLAVRFAQDQAALYRIIYQ